MDTSIFRRSRAAYSVVSGGNWSKFKLIQAFMYFLVTRKYEKDPIKNSQKHVDTVFSIISIQFTGSVTGDKPKQEIGCKQSLQYTPAMCRSKPCKFVKKYFFIIKLLHAHLQYVCNIPAKYQMNILKALGGVEFTRYPLLPISKYVHWKKNG